MATGFVVNNVGDLDTLFKAYASGTKAGATGLKVGSTDLADIFQQSNYEGFDQITQSTSFFSKAPASGTNGDLKFIFQKIDY